MQRRTVLIVAFLAAAGLRPPPAAAQSPVSRTLITTEFRDTPLREALEQLFRRVGQVHAVEPTVPDVPVTLTAMNAPFSTVLRSVIAAGPDLTYRIDGGVYIVGRLQPNYAARIEKRTLSFKGTPLRRAMAEATRVSGDRHKVAEGVSDVPIYLWIRERVSRLSPGLVAQVSGLPYTWESGTWVLHRPAADAPAAGHAKGAEPKLSLHLQNVPLRRALEFLFHAAGRQYRIAPGTPEKTMTVIVRDANFQAVLESVLRLAGATHVREADTFVVRGPEASRAPGPAAAPR